MTNKAWPNIPLKKLTARIGDGIHGTPTYVESSGYPFINGNNLRSGFIEITPETKKVSAEEYKKYFIKFDEKTLFLSINGTLGSLAKYRGENVILGKSAAYIKCTEIDIDFLYYYLQLDSIQKCMWDIATGSTIKNLSLDAIRNLKIPTPSEVEQKRIAAILSVLDSKIDCNNRINSSLETIAKTLYNYWFVQFDFPDANGKPYKSSGGKMTYNAMLKREIPIGWKEGTLRQFIDLERGVTYGKEDVCTSGAKNSMGILRATNVTGNVIDIDDLVYVPANKVNINQRITKFATLIVMSSGSKQHVGKNGIYYFDVPLGFGAFCSMLMAKGNSRFFINTFLQSDWFKVYIKNQCLGTNINNLTNDHINDCPIIMPSEEVITRFECTIKSTYEKIASNTVENYTLKQLRNWLLPMLMNGQVKVNL